MYAEQRQNAFRPLTPAEQRRFADPRDRFRAELLRCASDDEDGNEGDGDAGISSSRSADTDGGIGLRPATAASIFAASTEPERVDLGLGAGGAPRSIGTQLLAHMREEALGTTSPSNARADGTVASPPLGRDALAVASAINARANVEAYTPTSVGGFLTTGMALPPDPHSIKVGDVLVRVANEPQPTTAAASAEPPSPGTAPISEYAVRQGLVGNTKLAAARAAIPLTSSSRYSGAPANSAVGTTAVKPPQGLSFVQETTFSEEERLYGKVLDEDMCLNLFEVARVDVEAGTLLAIFVDGSRLVLTTRHGIRRAGLLEATLFRKWKADPSTRPVQVIRSATQPVTASASPGAEASGSSEPSMSDTAVEWWVLRNLLVRVVAESAPADLCGKKFVVKKVNRQAQRIRLAEWEEKPVSASLGEAPTVRASPKEVDMLGQAGIETVLPKVGGRALVVVGAKRGEIVTLTGRVRDADGSMKHVRVRSLISGEEYQLGPDEVCAMAEGR